MDKLKNILKSIKELQLNVDSVIIEENGIIEKEIINNIDMHQLRSSSKLLIVFAYGIAINEKLVCKYTNEILTLDTKVYSTFENIYNGSIPNEVKEWTIKTLLTHSTGYEKMMLTSKELENYDKFNLINLIFNTPIKYQPNNHFTYNNVEPYLLSIFFQENFGVNISDFINDKIFKKLDINNYI